MTLGKLSVLVSLLAAPTALEAQSAFAPQDTSSVLSCASFSADLREADLVRRFGAANVDRDSVPGADDGPQDATVIFPGDAERRLEFFWQDTASRARPRAITARGERSGWRTPGGITLGTSLRVLERMNGGSFRLSGFRQELPGHVRSWNEGRLQLDESNECRTTIQLSPPDSLPPTMRLIRQLSRRGEYSSGHPAMQAVNPTVVSITLRFERR